VADGVELALELSLDELDDELDEPLLDESLDDELEPLSDDELFPLPLPPPFEPRLSVL
jgi:hypothetical protein